MTKRNKSTLPARQRKAGAHQDGARRPETVVEWRIEINPPNIPIGCCHGRPVGALCPHCMRQVGLECSAETPPPGGEWR
jgi:hypothetical protein